MTLTEQIIQLLGAAAAGGSVGALAKAVLDRRKTRAEADKNEADAGAVTIQALRQLVVDLMAQVSTLNSQYTSLHQSNAQLAVRNAELAVELAAMREINRKLEGEVAQHQIERDDMQRKIQALEEHVRQLEKR